MRLLRTPQASTDEIRLDGTAALDGMGVDHIEHRQCLRERLFTAVVLRSVMKRDADVRENLYANAVFDRRHKHFLPERHEG